MTRILCFTVGFFLTISVVGQETKASVVDTTKGKISITGFVDTYYSYNTNKPGALGNWGTTGVGRIFDGEYNQIAFNMLQTKITYKSKRLQIVGDLLFGPGADIANYGNTGTSKVIKQAYLAYNITDKLAFTIGQFGTYIGYEVIDSPDNFNYSVSYLFGNGPFYHTGAKLAYAMSDKIGLMVGVLNGWDDIIDNNLAKSFAAQVSLTPNDNISINLNWIGGNEDPSSVTGDTLKSYKNMTDLTANFAITKKFNVGLNAAIGFYSFDTLATKNWGGAALYLNYTLSNHFAIGVRTEFFDDVEGVQYLGASYVGYTLTGVITTANKQLFIKPELRYDSSNSNIYYKGDAGDVTNRQITMGIAFVAKF